MNRVKMCENSKINGRSIKCAFPLSRAKTQVHMYQTMFDLLHNQKEIKQTKNGIQLGSLGNLSESMQSLSTQWVKSLNVGSIKGAR